MSNNSLETCYVVFSMCDRFKCCINTCLTNSSPHWSHLYGFATDGLSRLPGESVFPSVEDRFTPSLLGLMCTFSLKIQDLPEHAPNCKIHLLNGLFPLTDSDSDTNSCTMQDFSIGSDSDSDPLIEMNVIGTEICPWDGDPSLK